MIEQLKYLITKETDPYKNLALEEYLFSRVGEKECILYLWQNEKTVVIGRNQNPWKECRIKELEEDGGKLVRRLSGGGAVFHDLGNLNFTFLVSKENYDVEKQLEVIVNAVNRLGIPAMKSGRNDITVEGRKFSGNAFYSDGIHSYHHGTILIRVDMSRLSTYLNVSRDKLVSKGVDSVRSRVANLTEYIPELTIAGMAEELIKAFGEVYGRTPKELELRSIPAEELGSSEVKFSSWEWNFGRKLKFSDSLGRRFSWGDIELQLNVEAGIIQECAVYSDALETGIFERIAEKLTGCPLKGTAMTATLRELSVESGTEAILADVITLIEEEGI
jgi:lipoate-protein ligase A